MDRPTSVSHSLIGIWVIYGLTLAGAIADAQLGHKSFAEFIGILSVLCVLSFLPYGIGKGNQCCRMLYAALCAMSIAASIFGQELLHQTTIDRWVSVASFPVQLYVLFLLFKTESAVWFATKRGVTGTADS